MCEIYDDGDRASVWNEKDRRAAKPHRCEACGVVILTGEKYRYGSGVYDHRGYSERGCLACAQTRTAFCAAHDYYPSFDHLDDTLANCIAEGDPESLGWKTHLDALRERREAARAAKAVTKALVGWFQAMELSLAKRSEEARR